MLLSPLSGRLAVIPKASIEVELFQKSPSLNPVLILFHMPSNRSKTNTPTIMFKVPSEPSNYLTFARTATS